MDVSDYQKSPENARLRLSVRNVNFLLAGCLLLMLGLNCGYFIANILHRDCTCKNSDYGEVKMKKNGSCEDDYSITTDPTVTCPPNMIYGKCTPQNTCDDPNGESIRANACTNPETCICPDGFLMKGSDCVPITECGCFLSESERVLPNGDPYVSTDCTTRCNCSNGELRCNNHNRCSPNANCREKNGVRECYCNEGYEGDGQTCSLQTVYRDCYDAYQHGNGEDGVYTILPSDWHSAPFEVLCNMSTDGGGWTVFQRRIDGRTDFYRNWEDYKHGFGSLHVDFWLGNERLYYLTKQKSYELRVDLVTSENSLLLQTYPAFGIANESENYRLIMDRGSNDRTGMIFNIANDFSTFDRDNDRCATYSCAQEHRGGWWYGATTWCTRCYSRQCSNFVSGNCNTACSDSNLNGDYKGGNGQTIIWYRNASGRYCNIKYADMKIRPRQ